MLLVLFRLVRHCSTAPMEMSLDDLIVRGGSVGASWVNNSYAAARSHYGTGEVVVHILALGRC